MTSVGKTTVVLGDKALAHVVEGTDEDGNALWGVPFVGGSNEFYSLSQALEFAVKAITLAHRGQEQQVAWVYDNKGMWQAFLTNNRYVRMLEVVK